MTCAICPDYYVCNIPHKIKGADYRQLDNIIKLYVCKELNKRK